MEKLPKVAVHVGQILDKYELIEKVGQGGMAVVYRGRDTNLRREVAVKVLHHHLAEHLEARERFEREAHAVAKLRHENILEIYDFSGSQSEESYIVTEFIDGMTLKEFVTAHPIQYPEIGAMITLQICRALVHAHGLGVLHRDVKPENVMIRRDGVLKLTDFGIAQMVDLQRMTVTGQLLGSPAYMAPEHVEGRDLDFRTDVFAVGIVLYQLVTSELPFQGKNPHEILKRIAECQYRDPRRLNPRVGKELAAIISKALAREPDDRYADVSLMQQALEQHLEGSGLTDHRAELARFFDAPAAYQMALRTRLVGHLTQRARDALKSNRNQALELFNRVLSLDESNQDVIAILGRISRRQRALKIAGLLASSAAIAAVVIGASQLFATTGAGSADANASAERAVAPTAHDAHVAADGPNRARDAALAVVDPEATADAGVDRRTSLILRRPRVDAGTVDAGAPAVRQVTLSITPRGSEYRVDQGEWRPATSRNTLLRLPPGRHVIAARNDACCQSEETVLAVDTDGGRVALNLKFLPGRLTPLCDEPGVRVQIGDNVARLGRVATIPIERLVGSEVVEVRFFTSDEVDAHTVTVFANKLEEVRCQFQ